MKNKLVCDAKCVREQTAGIKIPKEPVTDKMGRIFSLLGDISRLKIIFTLMEGERCVCEIQEVIGAQQAATSHHLRLLKDNGILKSRREGKSVYYYLADQHINTILHTALEHVLEDTGLLV